MSVTLAIVAVVLAAAELALRSVGWKTPISLGGHPYVNLLPMFRPATRESGTQIMLGNGSEEFLAEKPADGFRVFVLGESSVFGSPYGPAYSFSAFLAKRLAVALPGRSVEVVNAAVPAASSWLIRWVAEEIVAYEPDVVLLYAGHNEFIARHLEVPPAWLVLAARSRVLQLAVWAGNEIAKRVVGPEYERVAAAGNQPVVIRDRIEGRAPLTTRERGRITQTFLRNFAAIVSLARAAGALPVVATVAQNLADWPPAASRRRPLPPAAARAWEDAVARGHAWHAAGQCDRALVAYGEAAGLDAGVASLEFARGRCWAERGDFQRARRAYRRASDLDVVPLGAPSSFNRAVVAEAARLGVPVIDVARELSAIAHPDVPGAETFVDFIHPNLRGNQSIAAVLERGLRVHGIPASEAWSSERRFEDPDPDVLLAANPDLRRQEHYIRSLIFHFTKRFDDAERERDAIRRLREGLPPDRLGARRRRRPSQGEGAVAAGVAGEGRVHRTGTAPGEPFHVRSLRGIASSPLAKAIRSQNGESVPSPVARRRKCLIACGRFSTGDVDIVPGGR